MYDIAQGVGVAAVSLKILKLPKADGEGDSLTPA